MKQYSASRFGSRSLALLGVACAFGLSSCSDESQPGWWKSLWGDKDTTTAETTPAQQPETPVAQPVSNEQKELLDYMIYSVGSMASRQAANPLWREEVRNMRSRIETYYNTISADDHATRTKLGLFLADSTRDLTAYSKALEIYAQVLKDWEALPEADRTSIEGRRSRSAIANGMGSCYLGQRKAKEALPYYEEALEIDKGIYNELAPSDGAQLPMGNVISPDLARAAEDVLSSYRCLGECQFAADDPEEARDTYKSGQELAQRMNNLPLPASLQFIRLLTSLGNLENSCNQYRQAAIAWTSACSYAQQLVQRSGTPAAIQAQAARYFRELENSRKSIAKQLEAAQKAAEGSADPQ